MLNKTIKDLQEYYKNNNKIGVISESIVNTPMETILKDYANIADDFLLYENGLRILRKSYKDLNIDYIQGAVKTRLLSEMYNLKTLIGTLNLDYNPIENYRMVEQENHNYTQNHTGTEDNAKTVGERTTTETFDGGAQSTTDKNVQGARTQTLNTQDNESVSAQHTSTSENRGATGNTLTDTIGSYTDTDTHSVQPFNTSTWQGTEKNDMEKGGHTDIHKTTVDAQVNSSDVNTDAYTDNITHTGTIKNDSVTDTRTVNSDAYKNTKNTTTNTYKDDNLMIRELQDTDTGTRDLTRSGNIGVTTSQQMIESERQLAHINIARILSDITLNTLTVEAYATFVDDWDDYLE